MSQTEDDGFERFIDRHSTSSEVPTISIRTNKTLGVNNAAKKSLGDPSHVALLFNRKTRTIALEPASPDEKGAYRLRQNTRQSASFAVAAAAFMSTYGIPHDRVQRYPARQQGNRLLVEIEDLESRYGRTQ